MTMNGNYKEELKRNKRIVDDIKSIVVRSSHYSFPDGPETHSIYEIQVSGEGKYEESDEIGKVLIEKSFIVPTEEFEKLCLKIVDIMHRFDRVDFAYDDCSGEVELLLSGGEIILPRGMAFKRRYVERRYVEDAWLKFRDKHIVEQLKALEGK